jgi:hypothetical protein
MSRFRISLAPGLGGKVFAGGGVQWVDDYLQAESIVHCADYDGHVEREKLRGMIATRISGPNGAPMARTLRRAA